MTKKKSVMKVQMSCGKCRKKALQIAAGTYGVASTSMEGKGNDEIVVPAEDIDSVTLTRSFRKAIGYADLVTVAFMDEKKEGKESASIQAMWWTPSWPNYSTDAPPHYEYVYDAQQSPYATCIIMSMTGLIYATLI